MAEQHDAGDTRPGSSERRGSSAAGVAVWAILIGLFGGFELFGFFVGADTWPTLSEVARFFLHNHWSRWFLYMAWIWLVWDFLPPMTEDSSAIEQLLPARRRLRFAARAVGLAAGLGYAWWAVTLRGGVATMGCAAARRSRARDRLRGEAEAAAGRVGVVAARPGLGRDASAPGADRPPPVAWERARRGRGRRAAGADRALVSCCWVCASARPARHR